MLSKLSGRSLNQLANEAIKEFVGRRSREIENDLEATLADLRAYRRRDPDFETAIGKVAEAEAAMTHDPPKAPS
jgi:hypothetical protein